MANNYVHAGFIAKNQWSVDGVIYNYMLIHCQPQNSQLRFQVQFSQDKNEYIEQFQSALGVGQVWQSQYKICSCPLSILSKIIEQISGKNFEVLKTEKLCNQEVLRSNKLNCLKFILQVSEIIGYPFNHLEWMQQIQTKWKQRLQKSNIQKHYQERENQNDYQYPFNKQSVPSFQSQQLQQNYLFNSQKYSTSVQFIESEQALNNNQNNSLKYSKISKSQYQQNQTNPQQQLVLIGDSTIDNIVWVKKTELSISSLIRSLLPQLQVINYAADGFTSQDIIDGNNPSISKMARRVQGDPFPDESFFQPLMELQKLQNVKYILLSIGGNDIREILGRMHLLSQRLSQFKQNYLQILNQCFKKTPKLIVMLQYRPSFCDDQYYGVHRAMEQIPFNGNSIDKINYLIQSAYSEFFEEFREKKVAIIDLPNSFNVFDRDLYISQNELSYKGVQIIARLVEYVVKSHDFSNSKVYSLSNGDVCVKENNANFK